MLTIILQYARYTAFIVLSRTTVRIRENVTRQRDMKCFFPSKILRFQNNIQVISCLFFLAFESQCGRVQCKRSRSITILLVDMYRYRYRHLTLRIVVIYYGVVAATTMMMMMAAAAVVLKTMDNRRRRYKYCSFNADARRRRQRAINHVRRWLTFLLRTNTHYRLLGVYSRPDDRSTSFIFAAKFNRRASHIIAYVAHTAHNINIQYTLC